MKEFCDPMSAFDKPKCVFVVDQLDQIVQNSTPVGALILFMKCHGEPENNKML
jgi:hypothetical protein